MDLTIFKEFSKFDYIKFYDGTDIHAYFMGDEQVISVTGFIHAFADEFDEKKWLPIKAKELINTPAFPRLGDEDQDSYLYRAMTFLKAEWLYKNKHGIYEGSLIHKYLENLMSNKDVEEDKSGIGDIVAFSDIERTYNMMKAMAKRFYDDFVSTGKLIPIKSELVVGSKEHKLTGQIDQLFYNTELDCIQMYDWKTNTAFRRGSKYMMLHCLNYLETCELTTYSLQLHTYKYLLESGSNIRIHPTPYLVWFNEHNINYEVIPCLDMSKEVQMMLDFKKQNEDMFKVRPYKRPEIPTYFVERATPMGDLFNI